MYSLRESLLSEFEPDNSLKKTHRVQTIRLRPLRQSVPTEGRPQETQGDPAHGAAAHGGHLVRGSPQPARRLPGHRLTVLWV